MSSVPSLSHQACSAARIARDARFDGVFYTAVLSTGIYCRPICPARAPREENVRYYASAASCAQAGYRPCLRCRPDAAPGLTPASKIVAHALRQLHLGLSVSSIAGALAISDRHLRQLFVDELGVAPKAYQLYQRCLLAKQLLHQTEWPITQIAFASGFNSVRRFNDCFVQQLQLTPSQVRAQSVRIDVDSAATLQLTLSYRPPYHWARVAAFLQARAIPGLEQATADGYGRSFYLDQTKVSFFARHHPAKTAFDVRLELANWALLPQAVQQVRRILDLDANSYAIDQAMQAAAPTVSINEGLRLPQFPSLFEAGVRAILGQQVSVAAARNLVEQLVTTLGELDPAHATTRWFPEPQVVAEDSLLFLKMPGQRRDTVHRLAQFCVSNPGAQASDWLALKGIGPWTVDYARMRGEANTDIWLSGDLGVKHGLAKAGPVDEQQAAPWRSYLTLQMWSQLA